jgi:pimeloyl-ACP methyl ester carboxylesterase
MRPPTRACAQSPPWLRSPSCSRPQSLKAIAVPALIYAAEKDRWLPPRFHAAWIAQNMPSAIFRVIPNAWRFAFMNKASFAIPTLDGDGAR